MLGRGSENRHPDHQKDICVLIENMATAGLPMLQWMASHMCAQMKPYVDSVAYLKKVEVDMQLGERCIREDPGGLGMS